jgi:hypothetical protein
MSEARYQSYLLRCWCDGSRSADGTPAWRLSISRIGSDETTTFLSDTGDLTAFLQQQLAGTALERAPVSASPERQPGA